MVAVQTSRVRRLSVELRVFLPRVVVVPVEVAQVVSPDLHRPHTVQCLLHPPPPPVVKHRHPHSYLDPGAIVA